MGDHVTARPSLREGAEGEEEKRSEADDPNQFDGLSRQGGSFSYS